MQHLMTEKQRLEDLMQQNQQAVLLLFVHHVVVFSTLFNNVGAQRVGEECSARERTQPTASKGTTQLRSIIVNCVTVMFLLICTACRTRPLIERREKRVRSSATRGQITDAKAQRPAFSVATADQSSTRPSNHTVERATHACKRCSTYERRRKPNESSDRTAAERVGR